MTNEGTYSEFPPALPHGTSGTPVRGEPRAPAPNTKRLLRSDQFPEFSWVFGAVTVKPLYNDIPFVRMVGSNWFDFEKQADELPVHLHSNQLQPSELMLFGGGFGGENAFVAGRPVRSSSVAYQTR